ncbi:MAG: ABC transporter substrate-binding protein [Desulfobacterales bacterium]
MDCLSSHLRLSKIAGVFLLKVSALVLICIIFLGNSGIYGVEIQKHRAVVLVSLNIRPYLEALEALEETILRNPDVRMEVFFLDNYEGKRRKKLLKRISGDDENIFIAIGPEAARFVWTEPLFDRCHRIFTMVLNPEKVIPPLQQPCGISLNIPVETQVRIFKKALPLMKSIGLLYNAEYNATFSKEAMQAASEMGLKIIPLEVSLRKEIPNILSRHWSVIDGLWMIPDHTIIAESLVRHIIKESISHGVPVIGFNRFFYESGAALCYILDYDEIGKQTGRLLMDLLGSEFCGKEPPFFKVWYNHKVLNRLGLHYISVYPDDVETGPDK